MSTRGRRGWRSPVWRDPAWWYAVFCTALVSVLVWLVFFRRATSGFRWVGLAFVVVVLWAVFSGLIRIYVGVVRAHAEGKAEGERRAEERLRAHRAAASADETAPLDRAARSAGRLLGRAVAAGRKAAGTYRDDPPPTPRA